MAYEDFVRLGGQTDVPLRSSMLRRWAIHNEGCPDCGAALTRLKHCNACGRDYLVEIADFLRPAIGERAR